MRTVNSLKNVIGNFASNLLFNILKFVSRIIFIHVLSKVYLGVNALLFNVLSLLSLSELGISTAISYSLYKPLEENNIKKIKSLMSFYKKAYFIISIIILILGLILLPFLPWFIKDQTGIDNLSLIYVIVVINMVVGYLFSYKRTLITADQKTYKIFPLIMLSNLLLTVFQTIFLLIFKNYIVYLLVQTFFVFFENIIINNYINKEYPYLKTISKDDKLEKSELSKIKTNIKALFFHKIGNYVFSATDSLVISKFVGIISVGIYSNYLLVITMINSFITTITNNVVASLGNLLTTNDSNKKIKVFNEMNLICFILYGFSTVCFFALFQPFIELFFGTEFLTSMDVVILISFNNFLFGMTSVSIAYKTAFGLYDKDKYVPLIQSALNLTISIVLAIKLGLVGVFIGTFVSNILALIIKPLLVYKYILNEKFKNYVFDFLKKLSILIFISIIIALIMHFVVIDNLIICIIYRLLAVCLIFFLTIYIIYKKDNTYLGVIERIKGLLFQKKRNNIQ